MEKDATQPSQVQQNLISRRSVFSYKADEVDQACLELAFEAARHAPCHRQTHPWRFYVMGPETRTSLLPEVDRMLAANGEPDPEIREKAHGKIMLPPRLVAVTSARSPDDAFREEEDYAATVCAIQNFVLSLWDQGLGAQWSTGSITRGDAAYRALDLDPAEERIIGFIKVGYAAEVPQRRKKPLEAIRFYRP